MLPQSATTMKGHLSTWKRLAELRKKRGLSQRELADMMEVSSESLSRAELGKLKLGQRSALRWLESIFKAAPLSEEDAIEIIDYLNLDRGILETLRRPKPDAPPVNEFIVSVYPMLQDMLRLVGPQITLQLVRTIHATVVAAGHQPGRVDPGFRVKSQPVWNPNLNAFEETITEYASPPAPSPKRATPRTNAS